MSKSSKSSCDTASNFIAISPMMLSKPTTCLNKRQKWSEEEDEVLRELIETFKSDINETKFDTDFWQKLSIEMTKRGLPKDEKQVRDRWRYQLSHNVVNEKMSELDQIKLFDLQETYKNHWKDLAVEFPKRTDNSLKNQFFLLVKKALKKAMKAANLSMNASSINCFKPGALLECLKLNLDLSIPHACEGQFDWLVCPISVRKFIKFFAFTKQETISKNLTDEIRNMISKIILKLKESNRIYCANKSKQALRSERTPSELSFNLLSETTLLHRMLSSRPTDNVNCVKTVMSKITELVSELNEAIELMEEAPSPSHNTFSTISNNFMPCESNFSSTDCSNYNSECRNFSAQKFQIKTIKSPKQPDLTAIWNQPVVPLLSFEREKVADLVPKKPDQVKETHQTSQPFFSIATWNSITN